MILRTIIVVHRYVGVVLGVIMTLWCLSGFVMMYQSFPDTTQEERLAGLEALDLSACCAPQLADTTDASALHIEQVNGAPVARLSRTAAYDLATGAPSAVLDEAGVRHTLSAFAAGNHISGQIAKLEQIHNDQWTVSGARQQPLWRAEFNDPSSTYVYINAATGRVVQDANSQQRLVAWFGAIPHWLYPLVLRENASLWSAVVIWLSGIGCFLVVTGIIIGFVRLRGRSGAWWPYKRPMWMLHHIFGVFAGVLVLTWTFSGLLTMEPEGLLDTPPAITGDDIASPMNWAQAGAILEIAKSDPALAGAVTLDAAPFMGKPYLVATRRDGSQTRLGQDAPTALTEDELRKGLAAKGGLLAAGQLDLLTAEDDFYYGHKRERPFPVWRLTLTDPDHSRVYFDHTTGEAQVIDGVRQRYRWLENGLHSLDFSFLRARPLWDIVVLLLLTAVTAACATGAWLSFTRIGTDVSRLREMLKRK